MSYFPESIMPSRLKDESQDVKGNRFIISAADVNKHDEEIRIIQKIIGIRRPRFPTSGFVGGPGSTPGDPFTGNCLPSQMVNGRCPGDAPAECQTATKDVYAALENVFNSLSQLRDRYVLMTSGTVGSVDPSRPGTNGKIAFPTDWPIVTLLSEIPDSSVDDEDVLEDLESVKLSDVTDLPDEGGFITIINDAVPIMYESSARSLREVGYTSLASEEVPIYEQQDITMGESSSRQQRIFGLGTNVEILEYAELDRDQNLLLRVKRKQLGTTSTRHSPNDLVFCGRATIHVGPVNYRFAATEERKKIDAIDCVLRSDGSVEFSLRKRDSTPDFEDDRTSLAYVHYHATLFREIEPIPPFEPGNFGECEEFL